MKSYLLLLSCLAIATLAADFWLPHQHLPWRPLDLKQPIGFATGFKLSLLNYTPQSWCDELLQSSEYKFTRVDTHKGEMGCGWSTAYQLQEIHEVSLVGKAATPMRCPQAAASFLWLRELNAIALSELDLALKKVHHAGTYSCRRMYNRSGGAMSEHAYANAWDVTGFELADGSVLSIQKHWHSNDDRQEFVRAARDSACGLFNVVLSPDYNAAHHDHLHLDMGQLISCR